ncbi:MAG TPA: 5-oxoprolinase subunit PxpB [Anaerolineaceae bacterium]
MNSTQDKPDDLLPKIIPLSDAAVLLKFGEEISLEINQRVHHAFRLLKVNPIPGILSMIPAYCTLMVQYDPVLNKSGDIIEALSLLIRIHMISGEPMQGKVIEIPVIYGGDAGPDLDFVASSHQLDPEEVVAIHTSRLYPVYMMGFMPGFAYLGGVDDRIATPRLASPRQQVVSGSVGIAGSQTGIYPLESPGGWQIIGRTPLKLFDPDRDPPSLLSPGDLVRFVRLDG